MSSTKKLIIVKQNELDLKGLQSWFPDLGS